MSVIDKIRAKAAANVKHVVLAEGTEPRTVQAAEKIVRAVRENDSEEDILAALEKALGAGTAFTDLAYGQQGEGAFDLIFYPGDDPEAAARSAYAGWASVLGRLPGDGRYSAGLAMIETENGYYILIQNTVTQPAREPQEDEPE